MGMLCMQDVDMAPVTVKREAEKKNSAQHAVVEPVPMMMEDNKGNEVICISDSEDDAPVRVKRGRVILDTDSEDDAPSFVARKRKTPLAEPLAVEDGPPGVQELKRTARPFKRVKSGTVSALISVAQQISWP